MDFADRVDAHRAQQANSADGKERRLTRHREWASRALAETASQTLDFLRTRNVPMTATGVVEKKFFSDKERFIVEEMCWLVSPRYGLALSQSGQWRILQATTRVVRVRPRGDMSAVHDTEQVWLVGGKVLSGSQFSPTAVGTSTTHYSAVDAHDDNALYLEIDDTGELRVDISGTRGFKGNFADYIIEQLAAL